MEGQKFLEMEWSGFENLLHNDEAFNFQQELSSLDFWYPESSGINYDIDAAYLMDNPSEIPIHSSMDFLPGPTVAYEGSIPAEQDGVFSFIDQEFPMTNSLGFPSQEMSELGFLSLPTPDMNSLNLPSQEPFMLDSLSLPTQGLNLLSPSSQGLSMMENFGFSTQETFMNSLELPNHDLSMMIALSLPAQEMTSLDFSNQEVYMDTLEFPNQELFMLDTLKEIASLGFPDQDTHMNTLYQIQPVSLPMENIGATEEMNMVSSSVSEQSQKELDPNDGNGKGKGKGKDGRESKLPLRLAISREMIAQHLHLTMANTAKKLGIGTSLLKKRCRDLGISCWPQRKFKSLRTIVARLEEFGESSRTEVKEKVQEALMHLENERKRIEESPDLDLEDSTIRLREICYKMNLKKLKTL